MIPEGWATIHISDFLQLIKGITYSSSGYSTEESGHPFITIKCIQKNGGFSERGIKFYNGKHKESQVVKEGDVLFACTDLTRNGDIVGSPLKLPRLGFSKHALFSMDLYKVNVNETKVDRAYCYYWLMQPSIKRHFVNYSAGSTVLHLDIKPILKLITKLPPHPEQKKIAAILTSVDEAIEKQEAQIAKLQDLKKAVMQELLTQGIGHIEFKDSPVGRIPNGWEVKPLVNLSVDGINNGEFKDPKKVGRGYRLINVFDLYQQFGLEYENLELLAIDQKAFAKKKVENMVMCFLLALHLSWRESLIAM